MKIPFTLDAWLKDKSQKVETGEGESVCILCTNAEGVLPIIGNVGVESENLQRWTEKGQYHVGLNTPDKDLFIVTPEPEMSEFEKVVKDRLWRTLEYSETFRKDENKWVQELAAELLALAKQQLLRSGELLTQEHHEKLMETLREECTKDLPRWKKFAPNINDPLSEQQICAELKNSVMRVDDGGYCWIISRKELNKLPKED